jgi:N-acetylneuraminate synthase
MFGYSGHERGYHIPIAACVLGAVIIEKHFTDDIYSEGNDHKVSLLEDEFRAMVNQIKDTCISLGSQNKIKKISQGEKLNKISLSKGIYFAKDILRGDVLKEEHLLVRSPLVGVSVDKFKDILGSTIQKNGKKNHPLKYSHIKKLDNNVKELSNLNNFGIPVRFRDFVEIHKKFKPSFMEYHMFASDLNVNPKNFSNELKGKIFSIHAPEQFDDGFVLDLVSENKQVRERSKIEFLRVIDWVKNFMSQTGQDKIKLITNVGGATNSISQLNCFNKITAYEELAYWNKKCQENNIELLPQTMPPFPWHFGGQGFHRLFLDLNDLEDIQNYTEINFCMDISHTWMSMAHLNKNFYDELIKYKKYYSYFHLADAIYPGEEGVQIGNGEINFKKIKDIFMNKNSYYIPEVWNGHLNDFQGFIVALNKINIL